jgi:hypothetical protein
VKQARVFTARDGGIEIKGLLVGDAPVIIRLSDHLNRVEQVLSGVRGEPIRKNAYI